MLIDLKIPLYEVKISPTVNASTIGCWVKNSRGTKTCESVNDQNGSFAYSCFYCSGRVCLNHVPAPQLGEFGMYPTNPKTNKPVKTKFLVPVINVCNAYNPHCPAAQMERIYEEFELPNDTRGV